MLDRFDFQFDTRQREQMDRLIKEVDRLRRLKTPEATPAIPHAELERLRFENSELKLLMAVLIRILEAKNLTTPEEFIEMTEKVASEIRS